MEDMASLKRQLLYAHSPGVSTSNKIVITPRLHCEIPTSPTSVKFSVDNNNVTSIAVNNTGACVVCTFSDGTVRLFNLMSDSPLDRSFFLFSSRIVQ